MWVEWGLSWGLYQGPVWVYCQLLFGAIAPFLLYMATHLGLALPACR